MFFLSQKQTHTYKKPPKNPEQETHLKNENQKMQIKDQQNKKQNSQQNKMIEKSTETALSSFYVGLLTSSGHRACPGALVDIHSDIPLTKTDFPFASGYQFFIRGGNYFFSLSTGTPI